MYDINILTVGHLGQEPQQDCERLLMAVHYITLYIYVDRSAVVPVKIML